jgi:hypothetical protein
MPPATGWISPVLTEIEAFRALARYAPQAASRLPAVLDLIDLIPLDPPIRILAQTPGFRLCQIVVPNRWMSCSASRAMPARTIAAPATRAMARASEGRLARVHWAVRPSTV